MLPPFGYLGEARGFASLRRGGVAFVEEASLSASLSVCLHRCYANQRVGKYIMARTNQEMFQRVADSGPCSLAPINYQDQC
jgi:hypothetical protein